MSNIAITAYTVTLEQVIKSVLHAFHKVFHFGLSGSNLTLQVDVEGLKNGDSVQFVHLLDISRHEIKSYNFTYHEEDGIIKGMAQIQIPDEVCWLLLLELHI